MNKIKLEDEYFIDLLDKYKGKRDKRDEKGFDLVKQLPTWATDDKNIWIQGYYDKNLEGWEKLCVEAYLCGWIDYFDKVIEKVPDDYRTIYFKWEHVKSTSLTVYLSLNTVSGAGVPKPPPPPLG